MATDLTHWIVPLNHLTSADARRAGAKAASLGELMRHHFTVPDGICLTSRAYDAFLDATGLRERIMLELHRSYDNLTILGRKIEDQWIPAMVRDAANLVQIDLSAISDRKLAEEIERRWKLNQHWTNIYWSDFIPFAHGVRLFGQIYNEKVKPKDPYEFVDGYLGIVTVNPIGADKDIDSD